MSVRDDLRRNVRNEHGTAYYVEDPDSGRRVAGPFGTAEYAARVTERVKWPGDLQVVSERQT